MRETGAQAFQIQTTLAPVQRGTLPCAWRSVVMRVANRWLWSAAAVVVVAVTLALLFDWDWFKGTIERRVAAATGREFSIGDLDVNFGLRPRVRATHVRLGNADWSDEKEMATLDAIEFRIRMLPLLRGRIDLPYVHVTGAKLLIERNREGRGNWQFEDKPRKKGGARPPLIRDLTVEQSQVRVREPTLHTDLRLSVRSGERRQGQARTPLLASGEGTFRNFPFELKGRVDSPLNLQDAERPFHVDVRAKAGSTVAHVSGASASPLQLESVDLQLDVAGDNLGDLWPLFRMPLPDTPPYQLKGRFSRKADALSYRNFKGRVGDSDMAGDVALDIGDERPLVRANVVSEKLDLDDLAGLFNAPPSTAPGETASEAQRRQASEFKARPRLLPDKPYELEKLRVMDADVKFTAERIDAPKLPLERMSAHLVLENGVAKIAPLDVRAAGGEIASHVTLNARQASIETTVTAEVKGLELPKLFPNVELTKSGVGSISGAIALTAQGNSIAYMLGSANGDMGFVMGRGYISNLLVELAGLDIAESLKYLLDKDKRIPLRCAYADFKVQDGVMTTRALAFDTTDTVIHGSGTLNLRDEHLDFRLIPQPKDPSPLAVRGPLRIGGTLKDPSFLPEAAPLALRGAAAAALYAIAPPAALLALIETGPGKDIDCGPASSS